MAKKQNLDTPLEAASIVYDPDPFGPFHWDAKQGETVVSSHMSIEDAMRAHPLAHVSRASWEAYKLRIDTAMSSRLCK